ncbi:MAG TPA: CoA-binding protein [Bacteroidia bacterium]|nr:CoA-binding protein [Bacteroidia bacterium]
MKRKTVVLGASENPERYANRAVRSLLHHDEDVVAVGLREGQIEGVKILTGKPAIENVDTVTMYVGPAHQKDWYEYVLSLKPKRIIFNPGAENPEFEKMAEENGIEVVEACTLVMLSIGNY